MSQLSYPDFQTSMFEKTNFSVIPIPIYRYKPNSCNFENSNTFWSTGSRKAKRENLGMQSYSTCKWALKSLFLSSQMVKFLPSLLLAPTPISVSGTSKTKACSLNCYPRTHFIEYTCLVCNHASYISHSTDVHKSSLTYPAQYRCSLQIHLKDIHYTFPPYKEFHPTTHQKKD